jgi:hypothetical protein
MDLADGCKCRSWQRTAHGTLAPNSGRSSTVLTCVREKVTIDNAGRLLTRNAERI